MVTNAPSGPFIKSEEVTGGKADEALGVGSVVIAVQPITDVGLGGMIVGVERGVGVGVGVCTAEQALRTSKTRSENIRSMIVFKFISSRFTGLGPIVPQLS